MPRPLDKLLASAARRSPGIELKVNDEILLDRVSTIAQGIPAPTTKPETLKIPGVYLQEHGPADDYYSSRARWSPVDGNGRPYLERSHGHLPRLWTGNKGGPKSRQLAKILCDK